jgi:CheY-like chemotaxis protein
VLAWCAEPELSSACLVEAATLAGARVALASGPFDLLLLDMHLPDGDGLSLADGLRGARGAPAVVALSGAAAEEQKAARAAGCTAVLGKPYEPAHLCRLLADTLAARDHPGVPAGLPRAAGRRPGTATHDAEGL